jgi:hypothetical protein
LQPIQPELERCHGQFKIVFDEDFRVDFADYTDGLTVENDFCRTAIDERRMRSRRGL